MDANTDRLTGAYLRGAGLAELDREVSRAKHEGASLFVAIVDVNGLRAVNEAVGHAAGDQLLVTIASTLRARLRSDHLVVRSRDDEFVCALTGPTLAEARQRITRAETAIAAAVEGASVTVGLAQLRADDSTQDVIARAQTEVVSRR